MKEEIWKDIPEYEGYYKASNLGNVKSVERKIAVTPAGKKNYVRIKRSFILKPQDTDGTMSVILHKDNKASCLSLPKLVLSAFGYDNVYTYHKDGNYKNCALDNLIATQTEAPIPHLYTEEEVKKMLEKLKFDAIYCHGRGVRFIKVEDYLIK